MLSGGVLSAGVAGPTGAGSTGRRSSSVMSTSSTRSGAEGGRADPRPLRDKAYVARLTDEVVQYLLNTGYDRSISRKVLTMPSSKEFFKVCQHLLSRVDPSFEVGDKNQADNILAALKFLGYPASISKTAVAQSGTPHAWPQLAGMLHWLVQLLTCTEGGGEEGEWGVGGMGEEEGEEGSAEERGMKRDLFHATCVSYGVWMRSEDDAEGRAAADAVMEQYMAGMQAAMAGRMNELEERRKQLQEMEVSRGAERHSVNGMEAEWETAVCE